MSTSTELRPAFRRRFRTVARQIRSLHVGQGLAFTALAAAALLGAVAAADYFFELSWPIRAGLAAARAVLLAVLAVRWIVRPARVWSRARVARELEEFFPRLGQRLRTAAEHGGRPDEDLVRDGVAPGLVAALEEETAEKTRPLPFQAALPVRPALVWTALGLCCVAVVAFAAAGDPEWQTALRRAVLASDPYTTLSASASATVVDEGGEVEVRAELSGRARPSLILHARDEGDPEWRQETMDEAKGAFSARLSDLRTTTEFFVSAGPERTPVQQVLVRHPLKLVQTRVQVTAPAYTGLAVATHDSGSFSALQGSTARIRFEL